MRNLSTPRIRFSALCLGAALLLGTPAVAQDPWLRQDPNFQYQSVQGGQRHFPFDDSFKMPQNMTPYEHEAYNQGANVQALRGLNEGQFQALRGYLTALGSQVANERLQGHITAQNSGIFARPDQAVVNAWDSIRNTRGLDGRIGASPGDMKLVAQYMQTNDELRRIHAAVYGRPDVAGAADAARARASGMDMAGENSAASKGRLLRDFVAPGGPGTHR